MKTVKKVLAAILLTAVVLSLSVTASAAYEPFSDVSADKWFFNAVSEAYKKDFMVGTGKKTFSPDKTLTREEFTVSYVKFRLKYNAKEKLPHYEKMSFSDVKAGKWYSDYIEYAYEQGWISGIGNGLFGLGRKIKRQDVAVIFVGKTSDITHTNCVVTDWNTASPYAKDAVYRICAWVPYDTSNGAPEYYEDTPPIMYGYKDHTFRPHNLITRAECAALLVSADRY